MTATARLQRKRLVQRHGDAGNAQKENGVSPSSRETVHGNHLFTDSKECKRVDDFDNRTLLTEKRKKESSSLFAAAAAAAAREGEKEPCLPLGVVDLRLDRV
jgi:hypothetical protein